WGGRRCGGAHSGVHILAHGRGAGGRATLKEDRGRSAARRHGGGFAGRGGRGRRFPSRRDGAQAGGTGAAGLVIFGVLVDVPQVVEFLLRQDVLHAQHRRHHRMVLVVVLVHAVAADEV